MVALSQELTYISMRSVGVYVTLLIEKLMYSFPITQNDNATRSKLQREYGSIFFGPRFESG
jgi:hypothetical protein